MSAHTPGPWKVLRDMRMHRNGKKYGLEVAANVPTDKQRAWESAGYVPLAEIFMPSNPTSASDYENPTTKADISAAREANARLIAAAPALLEALERIVKAHALIVEEAARDEDEDDIVDADCELARAAIAQAKGSS